MNKLQANEFKNLLELLGKYGLGDYYALYRSNKHVYFGKVGYIHGHLSIKDSNIFSNFNPNLFEPVWHEGLVGMVCYSVKYSWESLTYYGLQHCKIKPDFTSTRENALLAAENQYGDSIMGFQGSIYRGFKLLLENSFLPVILLHPIKSDNDELGLVVSDLRTVPLPIKLLIRINDMVVESIRKVDFYQVKSVDMSSTDFHKMFEQYEKKE